MARLSTLGQIRQLDPLHDHQRILFLSTRLDFPFDTTRALELALFRTYCVPSISALLDQTGEFRPFRRSNGSSVFGDLDAAKLLVERGTEVKRQP